MASFVDRIRGLAVHVEAHRFAIFYSSAYALRLFCEGFNFHGYLPRDPTRLTQVFIEAPYRNNPMRNDLIRLIPKEIGIIAAVDLMLPSQAILDVRTNPELHKKCVVFVLGF
ncbi:MAG: hypothetical protein H7A40_03020 [Chlamydiales bacterium]|nr:hypothetical protein [Chlamydiales bacterium]